MINITAFYPIFLDDSIHSRLLPVSFASMDDIKKLFLKYPGDQVLRISSSTGALWDKNLGGVLWVGDQCIKDEKMQYLTEVTEVVIKVDNRTILIKAAPAK